MIDEKIIKITGSSIEEKFAKAVYNSIKLKFDKRKIKIYLIDNDNGEHSFFEMDHDMFLDNVYEDEFNLRLCLRDWFFDDPKDYARCLYEDYDVGKNIIICKTLLNHEKQVNDFIYKCFAENDKK